MWFIFPKTVNNLQPIIKITRPRLKRWFPRACSTGRRNKIHFASISCACSRSPLICPVPSNATLGKVSALSLPTIRVQHVFGPDQLPFVVVMDRRLFHKKSAMLRLHATPMTKTCLCTSYCPNH